MLEKSEKWLPIIILLVIQVLTIGYFFGQISRDITSLSDQIARHSKDENMHMPRAIKDSLYASNQRVDALNQALFEIKIAMEKERQYDREWRSTQNNAIAELKNILVSRKRR